MTKLPVVAINILLFGSVWLLTEYGNAKPNVLTTVNYRS